MMTASTCQSCGNALANGSKFCAQCGTSLADATIARPAEDPELVRVREAFGTRYRVESLLGRGGMGSVYRAYEPTLDRYVAIKLIPQSTGANQEFVNRFRREARLAAKLRHPRIVSIFEVGEAAGLHYFTMDYVEGDTLRSLVRRRSGLSRGEVGSIMAAVCDAVSHAHRRGIIHRDLKPENIMIGSEGEIFVMDFGLARGLDDPSMTASGTVMGTPLYMSPEQLNGESVDERSDVFALALITYYCLTGENLFDGNTISAIIAKQFSINLREAIGTNAKIPEDMKPALIEALRRSPDSRTPSVETFARGISGGAVTPPVINGSSAAPTMWQMATSDSAESAGGPETEITSESEARRRQRLRSLLDNN